MHSKRAPLSEDAVRELQKENDMGYERISGEQFDREAKPMFIGTMPTGNKGFADVTTFEETIDIALSMMREVMVKKQKDYGPGNIDSEIGIAIRSNDKVSRLRNLLNKDSEVVENLRKLVADKENYGYDDLGKALENILKEGPENESIEDTWMDLANYGLIGLMFHNGAWGRPLAEDEAKKDRFFELDDSDVEEGKVY